MNALQELENEIKDLIIECLNLEDITRDDIDAKAPLFGAGLELDSIDALEIGVALQRRYTIRIDSQDDAIKQAFATVESMAHYIEKMKASQ